MLAILSQTSEYQNWGYNIATVGALGVLFFGLFEAWGLWDQNKKIWHGRSGESVSFRRFAYSFSYIATSAIYGFYIHSASILVNRVLVALLMLFVVIGILKFKFLTKSERVQSSLFLFMIPAMVLVPQKDFLFMVLSVGVLCAIALQSLELYKTKTQGAVSISLLIVYIFSTLFWLVYAFSIHAVGLMFSTPIGLLLWIITLFLALKYSPSRRLA